MINEDAQLHAMLTRLQLAAVRDRLTEVLRALVADLDLSAFALLQVRGSTSARKKGL